MFTGVSIQFIWEVVANDSKLKSDCKRLCNYHPSFEDLYQDTLLYLFSLDINKLNSIWEEGNLAGYFATIITTQFNSKKSDFYRKYIRTEKNTIPLFTEQENQIELSENINPAELSYELNLDELFFTKKKVQKNKFDDYNNINQLLINKEKFEERLKLLIGKKEYQVYNLKHNYNLTLIQIAEKLNCSNSKVRNLYKVVREAVQHDEQLQQIIKDSNKYVN